jgi:hypothetical protein
MVGDPIMNHEEIFTKLNGSGVLIHHWDTDGICSARLLLEKLPKNVVNKTPVLGNYFLTEEEMTRYATYDFVIVVDMALPEDNIHRLAKHAKVFIFDHHLQQPIPGVFHHNPIGKGEDPQLYPSASWIVNDFLGNPVNMFALLGIVGDFETRIQTNKAFYSKITDFCTKERLTFDELLMWCLCLIPAIRLVTAKQSKKHRIFSWNIQILNGFYRMFGGKIISSCLRTR